MICRPWIVPERIQFRGGQAAAAAERRPEQCLRITSNGVNLSPAPRVFHTSGRPVSLSDVQAVPSGSALLWASRALRCHFISRSYERTSALSFGRLLYTYSQMMCSHPSNIVAHFGLSTPKHPNPRSASPLVVVSTPPPVRLGRAAPLTVDPAPTQTPQTSGKRGPPPPPDPPKEI